MFTVSLYQQNLQLRCCAKPSSLFLLAMCAISDRLCHLLGAGWCVLCLSASPYSWISFPQKPEPKGGCRYLYAAVFTREHLALAPWGLGGSQGMHTDPLAWKHSWGHQNRHSLLCSHPHCSCISCSSAWSPHPSVSIHTLPVSYLTAHQSMHCSPQVCSRCPAILPNMSCTSLSLMHLRWVIAAPAVSKPSQITLVQSKDSINVWPVDTVPRSPDQSANTGSDFNCKLLCFPILTSNCKPLFRKETTSLALPP